MSHLRALPWIALATSLSVWAACGGGQAITSDSTSTSGGGATSQSSSTTGTGGSTSTSTSASTSTSTSTTSTGSGGACSPVDPMNDGQPCGMGCPMGQSCIQLDMATTCYLDCDPHVQATCPCDRYCLGLQGADGGLAGGVCIPANGPGERCDVKFDKGGCAQTMFCINSGGSPMGYCTPQCTGPSDCPAQTFCADITDSMGMTVGKACAYTYGSGGKAAGATCAPTDSCVTGYLCDGTCKQQCDGPGGTCASGTCTALTDGTTTIGYVCK